MTTSQENIAAQKALTEALQRRKMPGTVDFLDGFRGYSIRLDLAKPAQKVSIIIPTKDNKSGHPVLII